MPHECPLGYEKTRPMSVTLGSSDNTDNMNHEWPLGHQRVWPMSDPWVVREHGPIFHLVPGPFSQDVTANNSSLINCGLNLWLVTSSQTDTMRFPNFICKSQQLGSCLFISTSIVSKVGCSFRGLEKRIDTQASQFCLDCKNIVYLCSAVG